MGRQEVWSVSRFRQRIGEARWTTEHAGGGWPLGCRGPEAAALERRAHFLASDHAEKDEPQPQVPLTLGFPNLNPAP